jgi:UDP-N-acetylmuramoyl-tripeptide--D-alanyl-D-alanine ligase
LNADDPNYEFFRKQVGSHQFIDFALKSNAKITASLSYVREHIDLCIETPVGQIEVKLNLLGQHNAMNALAAAACALALDVDLSSIIKGLEQVVPVNGRLQPIKLSTGAVILNDTYNANPDSMKAGIDVLVEMPGVKKILVAGDMGELGKYSDQLHAQIGEYAAANNLDAFLSLGSQMQLGAKAFGEHGFNTQRINELIERLVGESKKGCVILIKGSRSMRMERLVESLVSNDGGGKI